MQGVTYYNKGRDRVELEVYERTVLLDRLTLDRCALANRARGIHMKKYTMQNQEKKVVCEIICNKCGDTIAKEATCLKTDFLTINKNWGYFSDKDNEVHSIDLCERCYDEWVKGFSVPPSVKQNNVCI